MTRYGVTLGAVVLLACCGPAAAEPLAPDACAALRTEVQQLEASGARANMARGPDWAKASLTPDKLVQIKRLIEIDEQLLFRCQSKPLVSLPDSVDGDSSGPDAKDERPAAAKGGKAPEKAQPKPPPAKGQAKTDAAPKQPPVPKAPPAKADAAAKPKPKPKAKAKVDDAYRPPPVPPGTDPFAKK